MTQTYKSPLVVGLTGGIGAGKSTIVNTIEDMGIPVFDCDSYVHELYCRPENVAHLTERYGGLGSNPRLTLARMAWGDGNLEVRKYLESFFIPQVTLGLVAFIDDNVAKQREIIVIDAPTLLEAKLQDMVDWIVVVDAPAAMRYDRVRGREGMNAEKFNAVIKAQVSDEVRRRAAHSIIFNDGELEAAVEQTRNIFTTLWRIANA
jgi:dephospho-CoA kinase